MFSRADLPQAKPLARAVDKGPEGFVPRPIIEYKPRSLLADYKYLAIVFALLVAAGSVYLIRAPHRPLVIEPPPPPPVYIEPIPAKPQSN
jgi:hypothetical protein